MNPNLWDQLAKLRINPWDVIVQALTFFAVTKATSWGEELLKKKFVADIVHILHYIWDCLVAFFTGGDFPPFRPPPLAPVDRTAATSPTTNAVPTFNVTCPCKCATVCAKSSGSGSKTTKRSVFKSKADDYTNIPSIRFAPFSSIKTYINSPHCGNRYEIVPPR